MDMEDFQTPAPSEELKPCKVCGRTFFPQVLKKHVPICQKSSATKRKMFDSSRQRAEGTDIPSVKPLKPKAEPPKKPSNWRWKHQQLIATIQAAKSQSHAMRAGGPLPPPPPPSYDPDYVQCPYCQRRFGQSAAERHIGFCKEQAARISNKGKFAGETKTKSPVRSPYKPPQVKRVSSPAVSSMSSSPRLPQRSLQGQYAAVKPAGGGPSLVRTTTSVPPLSRSGLSGIRSPTSGLGLKSRQPSSPVSVKKTAGSGVDGRKVCHSESSSSRNDVPPALEDQEGLQGQWSKFCHECGAKYPVPWAKFCCECGVGRLRV